MAFNIFGYQISKKPQEEPQTPISPLTDGSNVVNVGNSGEMSGYYGLSYDAGGTLCNDIQMINRYREIAAYPDCDGAIEQIVNEAIIVDQSTRPITINLDNLPEEYNDDVKNKISKCFDKILSLLDFNNECHDIFKRWYIDGKIYYYVVIDPEAPKKGILSLKYIDPRKIRHITEYTKTRNKNNVEVVKNIQTYYLFNDNGLDQTKSGIKLSEDSVIRSKSGLIDANTGEIISYLFKAIKPVNQLKMMEDALVIYRITRAPERRVFYIDTGNMPGQKAEQYVNNIMNKFRNKVVYDSETGETKNNRNYMSMMEDFWLPRREGGKATEIQTLPPGQNLSEISDVEYFQKKLYQSLNVPQQRLMPDNVFNVGATAEITREEILFSKFIQRLRNNFNTLFKQALRTECVLTKVLSQADWSKINNCIFFEYAHDNYFDELKKMEVLNEKLTQMQTADSFVGSYFSKEWIAKNIMQFGEDEWNNMKETMGQEKAEEEGNIISTEDEEPNDLPEEPENSPDMVYQDKTDLDDTIQPEIKANPGEEDFNREATEGLSATK